MSERHGPHHGAQKSITTGMVIETAITSTSKVAVVTSLTPEADGAASCWAVAG